ncbi:hypothetical protein JYQ62_14130 [Nostoc sp. UHCC 0702]|nr:hypothetical protein JYQ62_14130 [Nostoc sp. UHCC 0702]
MENQVSLLGYALLIFNLGLFWYLLKGQNIKIHEQTQKKLNFTIQPKLLRFLGLFIGQIGVIFLCATFKIIPVTQLNCDRVPQNLHTSSVSAGIEQKTSSVICKLVELDFFGHQKSQKQIYGLIGTRLEKQKETDQDGKITYKYYLQLLTNTENVLFTQVAYSDYFHEEAEYIILKLLSLAINLVLHSIAITQYQALQQRADLQHISPE